MSDTETTPANTTRGRCYWCGGAYSGHCRYCHDCIVKPCDPATIAAVRDGGKRT